MPNTHVPQNDLDDLKNQVDQFNDLGNLVEHGASVGKVDGVNAAVTTKIPVSVLRQFSADGQVYASFGYVYSSRMGALLLAPLHTLEGCCDQIVYGCPVPWEEVYAVLHYPDGEPVHSPLVSNVTHQLDLIGLDADECFIDKIGPMVHGRESVLRLVHPSGIRFAVAIE